ncbi:MAG: phosphoribosylformylglycinamidine synthase I [Candidatus Odinarchaeia archaeon]
MKIAIIQFPGSNCDFDAYHVLKDVLRQDAQLVWHKDFDQSNFDAALLPGGFSYGDHLRAGIIAAYSPAMKQVKEMAKEGKPIIGICNGFQILIESGLLEGALLQNDCLTFVCKWVNLRVETDRTPFTQNIKLGSILKIPIAHKEGRYIHESKKLKELYENQQIVFKYVNENGEITGESNPNGSVDNIAGICNLEGNVLGLMPHPERASEKILSPFNTEHGKLIFESLINFIHKGGR